MLSASYAFRKAMSDNGKVLAKADLALADGTAVQLTGDDFMMGGLSFTKASSVSGSFCIGSAVVGSCDLKLNNVDGRFDAYDFTNAVIVPYVGVQLDSGVEWLRKGVYNVEQPSTYGTVISLSCTDNLSLLQQPYAGAEVPYPSTFRQICETLCAKHGLTLQWRGANGEIRVPEAPDMDDATCLDAISYAAQATGNFVSCDPWGRVVVRWYDVSIASAESFLDGGQLDALNPYATGDKVDGGSFLDYGSGDNAEGGEFGVPTFAYLHAFSSLEVGTDDVVITGVRVTAMNQVNKDGTAGEDGETVLEGAEGYVLEVSGNPFVPYGKAAEAAERIGAGIVGMRFRAFTASGIGDPTVEPGDRACVIDAAQRRYESYITSCTYKVGAYESYACEAKAPARNSAAAASAKTDPYVKARELVKKEQSARELAIANIAKELAGSSGLYMSGVEQSDGSVIYYMHDKPTVSESSVVWKLTADAIGVSTDGGKTYPYGLDVSGSAVLERIYAVGIDADYVNTGRIASADGSTFIDLDTGEVNLLGNAKVGGEEIAVKKNTVSGVDVEYAQSQSPSEAPKTGWSTTAPAWVQGWYIWQRTKTTAQNGNASYSNAVCISGRNGEDGKSPTVTVSKSGAVSTITATNPDGTSSTVDVNDGSDGTPGANGYVHVKYSDDGGKTFTGNSGEDAGRYIGVYTDNTLADSVDVNKYTWSLIKGADGDDGLGIGSISEQYYLSASAEDQVGGAWSAIMPVWMKDHYYWTRSRIVWSDGSTTYTDPVLASALTDSSSNASDAQSKSDELQSLIRYKDGAVEVAKVDSSGAYSGSRTKTDSDGFSILDVAGNVISSFGKTIIELGKNAANAAINMLGDALSIYVDSEYGATISVEGQGRFYSRYGKGTWASAEGNQYSYLHLNPRKTVGEVSLMAISAAYATVHSAGIYLYSPKPVAYNDDDGSYVQINSPGGLHINNVVNRFDTKWQTLKVANGSSYWIKYMRRGSVVFLNVYAEYTQSSGWQTAIDVLPNGYRPQDYTVYARGSSNATSYGCEINVYANGNVTFYAPVKGVIHATLSFPVVNSV